MKHVGPVSVFRVCWRAVVALCMRFFAFSTIITFMAEAIMVFPSSSVFRGLNFPQALSYCSDAGIPLYVAQGSTVLLNERISLKGRSRVSIVGEGSGAIIRGNCHSLFQVAGKVDFVVENIRLQHTCDLTDKREVGAAIFLLGNANATLDRCEVTSLRGFGLWLVQRTSCVISRSRIANCGRSGVVGLGSGSIFIDASCITQNAVHGVCARGDTQVRCRGVSFDENGVRAVFAYGHARVGLTDCTVTRTAARPYMGTALGEAAAVEVVAAANGDVTALAVKGLRAHGNKGPALRVRGRVDYSVSADCSFGTDGMSHSVSGVEILPHGSNFPFAESGDSGQFALSEAASGVRATDGGVEFADGQPEKAVWEFGEGGKGWCFPELKSSTGGTWVGPTRVFGPWDPSSQERDSEALCI